MHPITPKIDNNGSVAALADDGTGDVEFREPGTVTEMDVVSVATGVGDSVNVEVWASGFSVYEVPPLIDTFERPESSRYTDRV